MNKMKTVAIIGAGQLGSRHLQALAQLNEPVNIQVIDPNETSLSTARNRFDEVGTAYKGTITYATKLDQLNDQLEVVVIATGSDVRKNILVTLLNTKQVKYLVLEKFLFYKPEEYVIVAELLKEKKVKAWVNCPRRMVDFYKTIKSKLTGNITLNVIGNSWGLASNGIHILDLFTFLNNSPSFLITDCLLEETQSKRLGYIEFSGTIRGKGANNSTFELVSYTNGASPSVVSVYDSNNRYIIHEGQPVSTVWYSGIENEWKWENLTFDFPRQSQMTHLVVSDLMNKGECELTPYSESASMHLTFLENLIDFLKVVDPQVKECQIT